MFRKNWTLETVYDILLPKTCYPSATLIAMSVSAILLVLVISKNVFDNAQFQTGEAIVS